MRRAIVTSTATVSGIILMLGLKSHVSSVGGTARGLQPISIGNSSGGSGSSSSSSPSTSSTTPATGSSPGSSSSSSPSKSSSSSSSSASSGTKTVTGAAADTRFGPVQVKVTFSGKKITNIDVVQYPTESSRDQEINTYALPILNQEAITAQSATIDAVSGATYTSDGYTQSLQSAIDQAGA